MQTLNPGASLNPIFVAPYDSIAQPQRTGWRHRPADHGRLRESDLVSSRLPATTASKCSTSRLTTLFGKPVLIWWQGTIAGIGRATPLGTPLSGDFVIYNQHYQEDHDDPRTGRSRMDVHEFLITPQSDAYFIATRAVKANLTAYGGPAKGQYVDPIIQKKTCGPAR